MITLLRFDLRTYLRICEENKVTRGNIAPPILLALAEAPEDEVFDRSSMRMARRVTDWTGIRIV